MWSYRTIWTRRKGPTDVGMGVSPTGGVAATGCASLHLNAGAFCRPLPPSSLLYELSVQRTSASALDSKEATPQGGPGQAAAFLLDLLRLLARAERTSCVSEPDGADEGYAPSLEATLVL